MLGFDVLRFDMLRFDMLNSTFHVHYQNFMKIPT
jgi:hypothetical protein